MAVASALRSLTSSGPSVSAGVESITSSRRPVSHWSSRPFSAEVAGCSLFMFMFRSSRRNALLKRLWRSAAVRALKDQPREDASSQQQVTQATHSKRQMQLKAHALFKRLSEEQLQALVAAVESGGACPSPCLHSDCPIGQDPPSSVASKQKPKIIQIVSPLHPLCWFVDRKRSRTGPPPPLPDVPLAGIAE